MLEAFNPLVNLDTQCNHIPVCMEARQVREEEEEKERQQLLLLHPQSLQWEAETNCLQHHPKTGIIILSVVLHTQHMCEHTVRLLRT